MSEHWPQWAKDMAATPGGARDLRSDALLRACADTQRSPEEALIILAEDRQRLLSQLTRAEMLRPTVIKVDKLPAFKVCERCRRLHSADASGPSPVPNPSHGTEAVKP